MMDNIIASKLYHASSIGYISKYRGMSNELDNILSLVTNVHMRVLTLVMIAPLGLSSLTISYAVKRIPTARCLSAWVKLVVLRNTV
jgi:hypothetical protein